MFKLFGITNGIVTTINTLVTSGIIPKGTMSSVNNGNEKDILKSIITNGIGNDVGFTLQGITFIPTKISASIVGDVVLLSIGINTNTTKNNIIISSFVRQYYFTNDMVVGSFINGAAYKNNINAIIHIFACKEHTAKYISKLIKQTKNILLYNIRHEN